MERFKLLLISNLNHNYTSLKNWTIYSPERNYTELLGPSNLPLGILSIEAYVKKTCNNVDIHILDLNAEFLKILSSGNMEKELITLVDNFESFLTSVISNKIHNFKPNIIGISSLFDKCIPTLLKVSSIIKDLNRDIIVIAGGHASNNLFKDILLNCNNTIDAVCLGEGEIPISDLLNSDDIIHFINSSPYFATKNNILNPNNKTFSYTAIQDLDEIPFNNFEGYFETYGINVLKFHSNQLDNSNAFNSQAILMTSRGCPYNCIFCASSQIHGKKIRSNSVQRVKTEIDYWIDKHNVDTISFMDDHFLFDIDRAIELIDYIGNKGVDIRFPSGLAIAPITKDLVNCFVRNKVKEVQLALESGSERVLKEIIHKPLSLKRAQEVFDLFSDTNIFVKIYLVIGFPDETLEDINEGLAFLRTANFHWCTISSPTPISGSRLMKDSLERGYISNYDYNNISFFTDSYRDIVIQNTGIDNLRYKVNLDINFVHNPYMRMGKYDLAKEKFQTLIRNYPDHAFAHYFLYKCLQKLDAHQKIIDNIAENYNRIVNSDNNWKEYARFFKLPLNI